MFKNKNILIGVTASIAAYKSAFLVRLLIKAGANVKVIMTDSAQEFITPLTLSTLSKNPITGSSNIPVECKSSQVVFNKDSWDVRLSEGKKSFDAAKQTRVFDNSLKNLNFDEPSWALASLVSEEFVSCWDKVLQGKVDPFPSNDPSVTAFLSNLYSGKTFDDEAVTSCVVCSNIRFSDDISDSVSISPSQLLEFLKSQKKLKTPKTNYMEFFFDGYDPDTPLFFDFAGRNLTLSSDSHLSVVFVRANRPVSGTIGSILASPFYQASIPIASYFTGVSAEELNAALDDTNIDARLSLDVGSPSDVLRIKNSDGGFDRRCHFVID